MRISAPIVITLGMLLAGPVAAQTQNAAPATPLPGPRADCTIDKAMLCKADGCEAATALGDLPLPARVLVDQASNVVATVGPDGLPHVSPIGEQATSAVGTVVLQGVDGAAGWMLHGSPSDTTTSFVISSNHTVLAAFGTCTPLE